MGSPPFEGYIVTDEDITQTNNNQWELGMRLEALDKENPHLICVASVSEYIAFIAKRSYILSVSIAFIANRSYIFL